MKIKQVIPIPRGKKYYAVYADKETKSGYFAERLDFLALVKNEFGDYIEGVSGTMYPVSYYFDNYHGTYSEDALKKELPELWEEMAASGDFQDDISPRDKGGDELSDTEKVYGVEKTGYDDPVLPDLDIPPDTKTAPDARKILLKEVRFCEGEKIDYHAFLAFDALGLKTLGDVADKTFDELVRLKFIEKKTMKTILSVLHSRGLKLKNEKSVYLNSVAKLKRKGKTLTEISVELNIPTGLAAKYLKFI